MKVIEGQFGKKNDEEPGYDLDWIQRYVKEAAETMRDTMGVDISRGSCIQIFIFGDHMVYFTTPDLTIPQAVYMCEKSKDSMIKGFI